MLVEPLQGSAGCIPGNTEFLMSLRRYCDDVGAMLIFDEVMTSRLAPGGAQELLGITPDLTTLGKYLAGGFTFGAFGGRRELMAAFDAVAGGRLGHAGTFNNNVVSMAAGVATLTEVLTPEVLAATNARGELLRTELNAAFARHGLPMCVTGSGSLMNVHGTAGPVTSTDDLRASDDRWKELLFFDALDAGFYLARRGFVALSIEITDDDIDAFVEFVDRWARAAHVAGLTPDGIRVRRGSADAWRRTRRRRRALAPSGRRAPRADPSLTAAPVRPTSAPGARASPWRGRRHRDRSRACSSASTPAKISARTFSGSGMFSNTESPVSPADSIVTTPLLRILAMNDCSKFTLLIRFNGIDTPRRRKIPLWYATRWSVMANRVVCHCTNS